MSQRPLRKNFLVNLLSPMAKIAVALVTIPIYLRLVGEARYGVISIVWVLLGFFGYLDLGLSRAVTNALAKLRNASQPERARVLLTTMGINLRHGPDRRGGPVCLGRVFARSFHFAAGRAEAGGVPVASLDCLPPAAGADF